MRRPSLDRYRSLFLGNRNISIMRALQYERLAEMRNLGRVLDFGGGQLASYRALVHCDQYESINIDPQIQPTWQVKIGEDLPAPANSYDTVLSMNTFEHVYRVHDALKQLNHALKPGGQFITMVPFLYPVHGHPDDFFRPTPSWWKLALAESNYSQVAVSPLYWGRSSTALTASGLSGPCQHARMHLALLKDLLSSRIKPAPPELAMSRAVGYLVTAVK